MFARLASRYCTISRHSRGFPARKLPQKTRFEKAAAGPLVRFEVIVHESAMRDAVPGIVIAAIARQLGRTPSKPEDLPFAQEVAHPEAPVCASAPAAATTAMAPAISRRKDVLGGALWLPPSLRRLARRAAWLGHRLSRGSF